MNKPFEFFHNDSKSMSKLNGCFDWASSFYDQTRKIPEDLVYQIGCIIIDKLENHPSSSLLEVGVGTGRVAVPISEKLKPKMTLGIDISEKMLLKCQEKINPKDKFHLVASDGFNLPFSSTFDIIITSHVLHLVNDHYRFVNSILEVLNPNGTFIDLAAYVNYQQTVPFKIFYQKLEEEGYRYIKRGDLAVREVSVFLSRRGWVFDRINLTSDYEISLHYIVRFIRDRVFSHQKEIPEELYNRALEYLYHEIEKRDLIPSEKYKIPAIAKLTFFQKKK
ncbi:MAG: class I SAM-dependent methyltransferase [Candidatus Hodarchaeales archaeon]|jgi:ubiquinone/menaquinone biosynthesis C-methylase UbiE